MSEERCGLPTCEWAHTSPDRCIIALKSALRQSERSANEWADRATNRAGRCDRLVDLLQQYNSFMERIGRELLDWQPKRDEEAPE